MDDAEMEIPTVKIELYRSNNKQFAEYLGQLLILNLLKQKMLLS